MKHLLIDLSGHGFGHLAQIAPILNELAARELALRVTLRTSLPEALLRARISLEFEYMPMELDKGMIMRDALEVNVNASYEWYKNFYVNYAKSHQEQTDFLNKLKPDLMVANVPYLSLDAADSLGIPSIALCSLNWADVFYAYCKHLPKSDSIYQQIIAAYNKAEVFLQPAPSMDMPRISNTKSIGPIAIRGKRQNLAGHINSKQGEKFILVSLGGIDTQLEIDTLPIIENINWIVASTDAATRLDIVNQSLFDMPYIDLLASVDLILTKTGYGAMVEAVTHQIPMLCIERPDWPEQINLFKWCNQHGYFDAITRTQLTEETFSQRVKAMLATKWNKPAVMADGARQAANILCQYLI